jgi:hypothetical protein
MLGFVQKLIAPPSSPTCIKPNVSRRFLSKRKLKSMIEAKDLRIGNLVSAALYSNAIIVESICSSNEDIYNRDTGEVPLHHIFPIQINDDWMVGFGFELFPWGWVKKSSNDFGVRINLRSYNYEVSGNSPVKIEFVHQLQNLFFVLTGEELAVANGS